MDPSTAIPSISVVLLNWQRPENIKFKILPVLKSCPQVQEIIISHGHPDTIFETTDIQLTQDIPVRHFDDTQENTEYGVALRFIRAAKTTYPLVLVLDDDIIPSTKTVQNMIQVFLLEGPRLVSLSGRGIQAGLTYSSIPPIFPNHSGHHLWELPLSLTQCCLLPRELANKFVEMMPIFEPVTSQYSQPRWNGEDIVLSLISINVCKKMPIICRNPHLFGFKKCLESSDVAVAIHRQPGHVEHRTRLLRYALGHLFSRIPDNLIHGFTTPRPILNASK